MEFEERKNFKIPSEMILSKHSNVIESKVTEKLQVIPSFLLENLIEMPFLG